MRVRELWPRLRAAPVVETAAFVAAGWVLWTRGLAPVFTWTSAAEVTGYSILWATLAWVCFGGIFLWASMTVSLADFGEVLRESLEAAAPAMWLTPAVLLIATLTPAGVSAGILLLAYAIRALASRGLVPGLRVRRKRNGSEPPPAMFGAVEVRSRERIPIVLGAFAVQGAALALVSGRPLAAAALWAAAAAFWSFSSVARGAYVPPREPHLPRALWSVSLTLLLLLSQQPPPPDEGAAAAGGGPLASALGVLDRLAHPPRRPPPAPTLNKSTLVDPGREKTGEFKDGMPGLILRPFSNMPRRWIPPAPRGAGGKGGSSPSGGLAPSREVSIPFSGEYHLFRAASGELPPGSFERLGTPMDAVYFTTHGGLMETHAYQQLSPPVDFRWCGSVEVSFSSGETGPATANLQLLTRDRLLDLGAEMFGLHAGRETLVFPVPASALPLTANAIRVVFHRDPWSRVERSRSARVAVDRFVLRPRGF